MSETDNHDAHSARDTEPSEHADQRQLVPTSGSAAPPPSSLEAALEYAKVGLRIFPGRPRPEGDYKAKTPYITEWQHKASSDPVQIRQWWANWPEAVICLPTGTINGLSPIDVDMKNGKDGFASMRALEDRHGETTRRLVSRTPSGGFHLFYRHRDGIRNSSDQVAVGVDIRGEGGYVVLPPSRTDEGSYEWWLRAPDLSVHLALHAEDMPEAWFQAIIGARGKK